MDPKVFFTSSSSTAQRQYEALRAFYAEDLTIEEAAKRSGFSVLYFKKLRNKFANQCKSGEQPEFFLTKKPGPQKLRTQQSIIDEIIALRKQNHSILDIKGIIHGKGQSLSLDTIDKILKREGFAPLPKRTKQERQQVIIPKKIMPAKSEALDLQDEHFSTEHCAGPLLFLPLFTSFG